MKSLFLASLTTLIFLPCSLYADTWRDPSFREMIANSDVIGLFRVVEGGSFKAKLSAVEIYKGKLQGEIWLGGFSNKYGPIDTFSAGQVYLLFVNKVTNYKSAFMSSSNFGKQSVAKKAFDSYQFVIRQANGYLVPTPTAGEYRVKNGNVFVDIAEVNERINGLPVEDLKRLILNNTNDPKDFIVHCKEQVRKNLVANNVYLLSNYLAMLELADVSSYDKAYDEVAKHSAWEAKLCLAKLLGKVQGDQSRDILVVLVSDSSGVVQGEAIRQLAKNQPADFLGPLLIRQIDSASSAGLYSSLMSPVRNTWESGKIEIIETLAKLKYKPAIPYLLPLLKTDDAFVFQKALAALVKLGSKEYPAVLNEFLADPALPYGMMSDITRVIFMEDLLECKDALLTHLSNYKTDGAFYKTVLLSTLTTLAEKDSTIETALLKDFDNFFSYYDTLGSSTQEKWFTEYINSFAALKNVKARPLVYRAVYEWTGLNPDRHNSTETFQEKREMKDSLKNRFSTIALLKKHKLEDVLFFGYPRPSFIVSVRLPDNKFTDERRKLIADALALAENSVYLVGKDDAYWIDRQNRFDKNFNQVFKSYFEYAVALPNKIDLMFLKALRASDRWEAKYFERELSRAIGEIEIALVN